MIDDKHFKEKKNCGHLSKDEIDYVINRYNDSDSRAESIYRIKNNIEIRPICPICGGYLKFNGKRFQKTCLNKYCIQENKKHIRKQTCLEKYGVENVFNILPVKEKCKYENTHNKEIHNKNRKQTCLEKYGVENVAQSNNIKEKIKQTCLEKYGVENVAQSNNIKEKIKQICLEKYGVNYYVQSNKHINKFKQNWKNIKEKIYNTKKKNNSFNRSNPEDTCYFLLKEIWPNVIRQYSSKLYPFNCDFYITEIDTYIEYQGFWTHGKKPFEGTKEDLIIINEWKSKHTKFYDGAINNWSIKDVQKRNIAKLNNLNWFEFFSIKEFKLWLQKYKMNNAKTR